MKFRTFKHTYHDGNLASFALGPRREITLEIALNPVWNKEGPSIATVRFGAIENYDAVAEFFRGLPQPPKPDAYIAEIYNLQNVGKGPNWVDIAFTNHGHVQIQSHHLTES